MIYVTPEIEIFCFVGRRETVEIFSNATDSEDFEVITTNLFLNGCTNTSAKPFGILSKKAMDDLGKQQILSKKLADCFWKKWMKVYLWSLSKIFWGLNLKWKNSYYFPRVGGCCHGYYWEY